jgi:hypothetical protein
MWSRSFFPLDGELELLPGECEAKMRRLPPSAPPSRSVDYSRTAPLAAAKTCGWRGCGVAFWRWRCCSSRAVARGRPSFTRTSTCHGGGAGRHPHLCRRDPAPEDGTRVGVPAAVVRGLPRGQLARRCSSPPGRISSPSGWPRRPKRSRSHRGGAPSSNLSAHSVHAPTQSAGGRPSGADHPVLA